MVRDFFQREDNRELARDDTNKLYGILMKKLYHVRISNLMKV